MKKIVILLLSFMLIISSALFVCAAQSKSDAPTITSFKNGAVGTQITFSKFDGASSYRVFLKSGNSWKKLADTSSLTLTHKGLKNNTSYTYTVRALNKAGNYVSDFDKTGFQNTFYSVPKLTSVTSVYGGLKLSWSKVAGIGEYTVFVKTASGWKKCAMSTTNSFTDKNVISGKKYTYTVKCSENNGKNLLSWHDTKGIGGTYVAAPEITATENLKDSVKITIGKVAGAYKYRYFVHSAKGWKAFATTTALSVKHTGVKNNTHYTYTVRALDKSGKYISAFNPKGTGTRFFAPPEITAVDFTDSGNVITWNAADYTVLYRLFVKEYGGNWATLTNTDQTSFTDEAPKKDSLYTYTLRYVNESKQPLSFYLTDTKYYYNGAPANGKIEYGGKTLNFTDGYILHGLNKIDGKYFFYSADGLLQKNGIVGNSTDGYYYANKNGVIDQRCQAKRHHVACFKRQGKEGFK